MSNVPTRIGNYKLERQIGKGGTGEVWLGRHQTLENRLSAIKLLMSQDPEWVDRFGREASITSRLRHDHIIQIFDHGYQPPFYYTIMEYVTGGALRSLLKPGRPLPLELTLRIFTDAGVALDYAHTNGVIHRDISPGNILVEQQTGRVLLTDFGIARESGRTGMTTTSKVMGTPGYLSPEHASSATAVTHLSDIYSIGVVLYEMLSGTLPWDHTPGMPDQTGGPFTVPPKLRERGVQGLPPDVDRVLQSLLAIDPAKRYPSVRAAIDDLDQVLARHTGPTQVVGGDAPPMPLVVPGFSPPTGAPQTVPSKPTEPHPVEKVLGPDLIKGPMQKARERAEALSQGPVLTDLLNKWSMSGPFRTPLLGRQAVFHRATSKNVYFYTLNVLYETREPVQTIEEPDHQAQPPQLEREQDRWGVQLPTPKGFQPERDTVLTLPGSTRILLCEVCTGNGRITCPRCKGSARVLVKREASSGRRGDAQTEAANSQAATAVARPAEALVPCPECAGSGSLKCDRCDGVGRLIQRKTTTWRRRPETFEGNDDLPLIDEKWLQRTCKLTTIYHEQMAGDTRPEWKLVPELAGLISKAQSSVNTDTRIMLSEVVINFIPITELLFDLGSVPQPAQAPAPAKNGKPAKAAKPAADDDGGLFRLHIYGFERALPGDWRFLNWDRVLMYVFLALLIVLLVSLLAISLLRG